ncbi:uncharacterized protein LOC129750946 [Uranotaenia lowii]|uniref:uncharacterized protein LOC129750946 n=1 Tax=Uranotaenia lowii TaxID=190385 RepID=UPI0024796620|nr:uncharacterized protein LOC129750946 [Uranotaenia lowii]
MRIIIHSNFTMCFIRVFVFYGPAVRDFGTRTKLSDCRFVGSGNFFPQISQIVSSTSWKGPQRAFEPTLPERDSILVWSEIFQCRRMRSSSSTFLDFGYWTTSEDIVTKAANR